MTSDCSRRSFLQASAASAVFGPPLVPRARAARTVKLGLVSPQTGPLAAFAEADDFIIDGVRASVSEGVFTPIGRVDIEIIVKDSQSSAARAAEAADELINEGVDILLAAATPNTTNPTADKAEASKTPCLTTDTPWQAHFFGRNGDPAVGFDYTYHFFWGLEGIIRSFLDLWTSSSVAPIVGGLFPNDSDGDAWADPVNGLAKPAAAEGYRLVDAGRFDPLTMDFSPQIEAFKASGVEIVTGVMIPPDFAAFWTQAAELGFRPKIVTIGKALLFSSVLDGLRPRGDGLTTEVWWSPSHPFRSSLTGQSSAEFAAAYMAASGKPWTQPLGFKHALFEVAMDTLRRASDLSADGIRDALARTDMLSIVGRLNWSGGPVPNVCTTVLVAGQWRYDQGGPELIITSNDSAPYIPLGGALRELG